MELEQPSIRKLRELVHNAILENPHITSRVEKAAFLVLLRPITDLGEEHYRVGSENGLRYYEVINGHCECHDYIRHGVGHPCKHRLALSFHRSLARDSASVAGNNPAPLES